MSFINDYFEYACKTCDAPEIFHRCMAHAIIGIAARNSVYFQYGFERVFPNFWMTFFAPSRKFRKSKSMEIGLDILDRAFSHEDAESGWITKGELRLPMSFSAESLWPILEEKISGYMFYSEFDMLIQTLKKDYNSGAGELLTDLYDVPPRDKVKKLIKGVFTIKANTTISILGATTISGFQETVKEADIKRGFIPRWLIIVATKKERSFPPPPSIDEIKRNLLVRSLCEIVSANDSSRDGVPFQMKFTPEARAAFEKWQPDFENKIDDAKLFAPSFYQLPVYVVKTAMVKAMDDLSPDIKLKHFEDALELMNYVPESLKHFEENEFIWTDYEKQRLKVLNAIKKTPTGSITRERLSRDTRIKRPELNIVIESLEDENRIKTIKGKSTGADKPVTHYVLNESNI